jgi:hypothetical protein
MSDRSGGVSDPIGSDRPPTGPGGRTGSVGAGVDRAHIDPKCPGELGEG